MAQQAYAYVTLVPVAEGFAAGVTKELGGLGGVGEQAGSNISGGMTKGVKGIGAAIAGAFAVGAVAKFTKGLITAGEEEKVANNRIANTAEKMGLFGDKTGEVVKRLQDYAETQQLALGVDDDVIKSSQAKLLTFKDLASTAGEAGGAFDRATKASLDLAATGFGSTTDNALKLGKALQDPVNNLSTLSRFGIQFTDEQQNMIKAMVDTSAASAAVAVGLFDSEEGYQKFIDSQTKAKKSSQDIDKMFREKLSPAQYDLMQQLSSNSDLAGAQDLILQTVEGKVGGAAEATATASARMQQAFSSVTDTLGTLLLPAFESFAGFISENIVPAVEGFVKFLNENPWAQKLAAGLAILVGVLALVAIGYTIWNSALITNTIALLTNPIFLIIAAVVILIAGIIYLATQTTFFQDTWKKMTDFVSNVWKNIVDFFKTTFDNIGKWFDDYIIQPIRDAWDGFVKFIKEGLDKVAKFFTDVFKAIGYGVLGFVNGWLELFTGFLNGVIDGLNSVLDLANKVLQVISDATGGAISLEIPTIPKLTAPKLKLAEGGLVRRPINALIGEAGPEVVMPLNRFESMVGLNGAGSAKTVNYYAAPNQSLSNEQSLFQAIRRAKVVASW